MGKRINTTGEFYSAVFEEKSVGVYTTAKKEQVISHALTML
jgi:hypothetical protein